MTSINRCTTQRTKGSSGKGASHDKCMPCSEYVTIACNAYMHTIPYNTGVFQSDGWLSVPNVCVGDTSLSVLGGAQRRRPALRRKRRAARLARQAPEARQGLRRRQRLDRRSGDALERAHRHAPTVPLSARQRRLMRAGEAQHCDSIVGVSTPCSAEGGSKRGSPTQVRPAITYVLKSN